MNTVEFIDAKSAATDFEQIASIHVAEISEGFLSTMPDSFLRTLYRTIASSPKAFLLVTRNQGNISGFLAASEDTGAVYKSMLLRGGPLLFVRALPKLFSFKRIAGILETLFYPARKTQTELPAAEIINFCVSSSYQRQGIGGLLFTAMEAEYRKRGIAKIKIITGEHQKSAQKFYEKLGAKKVETISVHKGTQSFAYTYQIDGAEH